jgi:guanylate kinase
MARIYVITGPSFVGKTTVAELLGLPKNTTSTSRVIRPGEIDGVHYYFKSRPQFEAMIEAGELVEHTTYNGHYYGTSVEAVQKALAGDTVLVNVMEIEGTLRLKELFPDQVTTIFLSADYVTLCERAEQRDDLPEVIEERKMQLKEELLQAHLCDYVIKNVELDKTIKTVSWLIAEGM